jgi:subtilisin family serine protease
VAYNAQIMAIKAAQYSGVLTTADIAEGILYAVDKGADVINMSFGGYFRSQLEEDALSVAFSQAVLVAAAGNDAKNNEVICGIPSSLFCQTQKPFIKSRCQNA